ncbi:MAG: hypothetical protein A3F54_02455 [Candidatus Kerfeldbacteria bacterium RIFCSPHIGHO2_12_FULL_48_17]|uniref:Uncharacterized protein n=1 Tax=Candidatus Kerfeldbacteria bacterium RIFCSPHIGHO2_12_FULL_48_17 TaxID=1798542 RepID=A0A1G2B7Y1_9BACT|nr:MAG: hypothetical protein A3F54_02455 [Candidatus Kerfeldbacteria bacterium RIFCSPHIGHO2_12_FULL_48_17]
MPIPQVERKHTHQNNNHHHQPTPKSAKKKGKKGWRTWSWKKKILAAAGIAIVVGALGMGGAFAWYAKDLPDPGKLRERQVAQSTQIYDRTGTILLYEIHGAERRTIIKLTDLPPYVKNATIVTEDRGFYKHPGFDVKGIIRALLKNVLKGDITGEGGSTITQQFIKNAVLTSEKHFDRKIKEVVLAYELERKFSKDEILEMYLNEIPYGSTAYGIESASQFYFAKSAKDLTLAEAAILSALPQRPTYYSPYGNHTDQLFARQQYILGEMAKEKHITEAEAEAAKAEKITFAKRIDDIRAPHFVFYVRDILEQKYPTSMVEEGGLKVITTLDIDKQVAAEEAIRLNMDKVEQYGGRNAALVSMDTHTGQVLAMAGGKNYFGENEPEGCKAGVDCLFEPNVNVALSQRQPGSSIKPIIYASAWEKGYTPETILFDLERDFPIESGTYHPRNYDLSQHGPLQMKQTLSGSLNVPAVMTTYLTGVDRILDNLQKFGYTTFNDRSRYGLSIGLGSGEVTLLEHTNTFAMFAREGEYHQATPILKIQDNTGKVLEEFSDQPKQVFDEMTLRRLNKVLSTDGLRAFVFGARSKLTLPDRPVAAKTGTTNDFHDGWTMGYTPSLAAGVWVGNNDNTPMSKGADGSIVATPIWNEYMLRALEGTPVEEFKNPEPAKTNGKDILKGEIDVTETHKVDKVTGKVIPDECADKYPAEFVETREFKETHDILHWVNKDEPLGAIPKNPEKDPYYNIWEAVVKKWAEGKEGYTTGDLDYESCDLRNSKNAPTLTIKAPVKDGTLTSSNFDIDISVSAGNGRSIKKVEYFVDNNSVDTKTTAPFQSTYAPTTLSSGKHALKVKATDNLDSTTEQSVSFTFTADSLTDGDIYFTDPSNSVTYTTTSFPKTLKLHVGSPTQISQIKFYYFDNSKNNPEHITIATFDSASAETVSARWSTAPTAGDYTLYAKVTTKDGATIRTKNIPITITSGTPIRDRLNNE